MFKKLVKNILESSDFDEAFGPVDRAFQDDKISWADHQILLGICNRIYMD